MAKNPKSNVQLFIKRWNISFNESVTFYQFKNRLAFLVEQILGKYVSENESLQNRYAYMLGEPAPIPNHDVYRINLASNYRSTQMYKIFTKAENQVYLLWLLQNLFVLLQEGKYQDKTEVRSEKLQKLTFQVEELLAEMPLIQVRLIKGKNGVQILPCGAKSLDTPLVNDVLDWLDGFPDVKKHYQEALLMTLAKEPSKTRNMLDNLRLSLEIMLKAILKNNQRLEEQAKPLKEWMVQKGIQENIRLMFTDLISRDRFTQLMNEDVKHGDRDWLLPEIEFLVYQTGVFFRFLIEVNQLPASEKLID